MALDQTAKRQVGRPSKEFTSTQASSQSSSAGNQTSQNSSDLNDTSQNTEGTIGSQDADINHDNEENDNIEADIDNPTSTA